MSVLEVRAQSMFPDGRGTDTYVGPQEGAFW